MKYVDEVLTEIDKAEGDRKIKLLKEYGAKHPYNMLLALNCSQKTNLDVPSGVPPYKQHIGEHPDTFQTTLQQQMKRLLSIVKGRAEHIPKLQKEAIFIQVLEGIPSKEAEVLIFAKDKALHELFPTITQDLVCQHFPQYCL